MDQIDISFLIEKLMLILVGVLVFLLPFFFLPITADFYMINKQLLLFVITALLFLLWLVKLLIDGSWEYHRGPFDLPVLLFLGSSIASYYFASINKSDALTTSLGLGTYASLTGLYFLLNQQKKQVSWKFVLGGFLAMATLLSILSIYSFFGLGELIGLAAYMKDPTWTPTGSLLTTVILLLLALSASIVHVMVVIKEKARVGMIVYGGATIVLMFGTLLVSYQLFTKAKPALLPYSAGWEIALETFKTHPVFGQGVENFLPAFTTARPITLNRNELWNIRFSTSSNLFLHIWTTLGMAGLICILLMALRTLQLLLQRGTQRNSSTLLLGLLFLFLILFPPNLILVTYVFIFAAFAGSHKEGKTIQLPESKSRFLLLIPMAIIVFFLYKGSRVYAADMVFRQALNLTSSNKAKDAYDSYVKAININPYQEQYRLSFAQFNLLLASAITKKGNLSDTDRSTLTQLIQQSISEARNAVTLNRMKVTNWEILAGVYKQVLKIAQNADKWTITSYTQAIALDPTNPLLRIDFGGVYFALNQFEQAQRQFELAAQLKPDLANAHYNLAVALREQKKYDQAISEMEATLKLVKGGSNDEQTVNKELADLKAMVAKNAPAPAPLPAQNTPPETLSTPQQAETQVTPPIQLNDEAAPPASETVQPEASVTPTSSPTPSSTTKATIAPTPKASPQP